MREKLRPWIPAKRKTVLCYSRTYERKATPYADGAFDVVTCYSRTYERKATDLECKYNRRNLSAILVPMREKLPRVGFDVVKAIQRAITTKKVLFSYL